MSTPSAPQPRPDPATPYRLARRCAQMNPSIIREILKVTEQPGIVSLAGGLPSADLFPVEALREAARKVLAEQPHEALQYATSEGHGPLREWIATRLRQDGMQVEPGQVLVTSGSQQGLDLVAKLLIDPGAVVRVESPTYLGALQAFTPFEPAFEALAADGQGPLPAAVDHDRSGPGGANGRDAPRFTYLVPNFQNPTGRSIDAQRRIMLARDAIASNTLIVEDNPYGELWYDDAPPAPIAAHAPAHTIYLGSLSKVLSPGLRLGYVVAPAALCGPLLQAKQAADLHTSGLTQRIATEAIRAGILERHLPTVRSHYRIRRDAMADALQRHFSGLADWSRPAGGMFFWLTLREPVDTLALLQDAVAAGVAFVPGAAFFIDGDPAARAGGIASRSIRLSFVTATPAAIDTALATLAATIRTAARRAA